MNAEKEKHIERYVSTGDLMDILSISRSTVYRLMEKGLPNIMVGSVHRFPMTEVIDWLENQNAHTLNKKETPTAEI
jgi:excisionase family DNA binding protein